jgi:hypothetical protein
LVRPNISRQTRQISLPRHSGQLSQRALPNLSVALLPNPPLRRIATDETERLLSEAKDARTDLRSKLMSDAQILRQQTDAINAICRENRHLFTQQKESEQQRAHAEDQELRRLRFEETRRRHQIQQEQVEREHAEKVALIRVRNEELERDWLQELVQRREEEEAQREARRVEELRRLREAEEAERRRQERLRECVVCMDSSDMEFMIETPCEHWYCLDDLQSEFHSLYPINTAS